MCNVSFSQREFVGNRAEELPNWTKWKHKPGNWIERWQGTYYFLPNLLHIRFSSQLIPQQQLDENI